MQSFRLTYCGNVHASYELGAWLRAVGECVAPVAAAAVAARRAFGLGSWWPAPLAAALATDAAVRDRVRVELAARDLELWTLNVFPYDRFHDAAVKTAVYAPDWSREERLVYTRHCAEAAAALSRPGALLPLSTLPLGYRGPRDPAPDLRQMARNLARAASAASGSSPTTARWHRSTQTPRWLRSTSPGTVVHAPSSNSQRSRKSAACAQVSSRQNGSGSSASTQCTPVRSRSAASALAARARLRAICRRSGAGSRGPR